MTALALARDPALQGVLRGALALLLGAAALHKLRDPAAFRDALVGYGLLPLPAVLPAAWALPRGEALAALALLVPPAARAGALAAAALLVLYSAAIATALLRGRRGIDCGCGGPGAVQPLGVALLVRNALLLGAAVLCALSARPRTLGALDAFCVASGALALALLYASAERALALAPGLRALRALR